MPADATRKIIVCLFAIALAGCGQRVASVPPASQGSSSPPKEVMLRSATTQGWGPMQYNPFHGVNQDNIYTATTNPTTVPADDLDLLPHDDSDW